MSFLLTLNQVGGLCPESWTSKQMKLIRRQVEGKLPKDSLNKLLKTEQIEELRFSGNKLEIINKQLCGNDMFKKNALRLAFLSEDCTVISFCLKKRCLHR